MPAIRHFYHVYAGGAWAEPAREHAAALVAARFTGHITVGLAGPAQDRAIARTYLAARFADLHGSPVDWAEWDTGFEQTTLTALHQWAQASPGDAIVLYAHTKGAYNQTDWNAAWRRSMTLYVAGGWQECAGILADGYDTAGCHWLTPEQYPDAENVPSPFYGGNFWWARAGYIATLPPPAGAARHDAELWIGLGSPRAYDLLPGWPGPDLCAPGQALIRIRADLARLHAELHGSPHL